MQSILGACAPDCSPSPLERRVRAEEPAPRITVLPPILRPMLLSINAMVPFAIDRAVAAVRPSHDFDRIAPALLLWLLRDDIYGVLKLTRRDDVRHALLLTCDVLSAQAQGQEPSQAARDEAELRAESAQRCAWRAMKFQLGTTGVPRVDWMVATAVARSIDHYGMSLAEALHCAMVAWGTPAPDRPEMPAPILARGTLMHLLELLGEGQS